MLDETEENPCTKTKVIDRRKRSKTLSEERPVKNKVRICIVF